MVLDLHQKNRQSKAWFLCNH